MTSQKGSKNEQTVSKNSCEGSTFYAVTKSRAHQVKHAYWTLEVTVHE